MGRTLPSITNAVLHEQQSLARYRRALRRTDQRALDDLLAASRHHLAASAYASHLLPFEIMLLSMLVEEHKQVLHLQLELERLHLLFGLEGAADDGPAGEKQDSEETIALLPDRHALRSGQTLHETLPSPYLPLAEDGRDEGQPRTTEQGAVGEGPAAFDGEVNDGPRELPMRKRKWWAGG
jgi:hypothetical protein